MIIGITKENYDQEITQSRLPVIIDVYATWCGPCVQMTPIFEELATELSSSYKFVKMNIEETREIAIKFGVSAIPTFVFIKNNQIKGKITGALSKKELLEKIQTLLGS